MRHGRGNAKTSDSIGQAEAKIGTCTTTLQFLAFYQAIRKVFIWGGDLEVSAHICPQIRGVENDCKSSVCVFFFFFFKKKSVNTRQ